MRLRRCKHEWTHEGKHPIWLFTYCRKCLKFACNGVGAGSIEKEHELTEAGKEGNAAAYFAQHRAESEAATKAFLAPLRRGQELLDQRRAVRDAFVKSSGERK